MAANPRLQIKRARFSALIERDLHRALSTLQPPNADESAAVDARQELDLRIGASFTRFQSLLLQDAFDWRAAGLQAERPLISYGPCQFPTLGLIVQRAWYDCLAFMTACGPMVPRSCRREIAAHVPEQFWYLQLMLRPEGAPAVCFQWARRRLYDHPAAVVLYERACQQPVARVVSVVGKQRPRYPPHPLSTLDMQKRATSYMRMAGERIMKLAEELYQAGYISYPRTETDVFDPGYDLEVRRSVSRSECRVAWTNSRCMPLMQYLTSGNGGSVCAAPRVWPVCPAPGVWCPVAAASRGRPRRQGAPPDPPHPVHHGRARLATG